MSIESLGFAAIGAGTPLPQSKGADAARAVQETTAKSGQQRSDFAAEQAAGVGQTDGNDHEIEEREGDGRMPWPRRTGNQKPPPPERLPSMPPLPSSRDANGQCGNMLDLTG
jgi:hypothetical protein